MPFSHHGRSDLSSSALLGLNDLLHQPVGEAARAGHPGAGSRSCEESVVSRHSSVSGEDAEGKAHAQANTEAKALDAHALLTVASSVEEMLSIPDDEKLEDEVLVVPQNPVRPSEDGEGKDDGRRPPSPFLVLCYGARGGELTSSGPVDVNVIDLEKELAGVRNKLRAVRGDEEERRQKLYEVWKLEAKSKAAFSLASPRMLRGGGKPSQTATSAEDDADASRTAFPDAASSVIGNAGSVAKGSPLPPPKTERVREDEKDAGNETLVGQASDGCEDDTGSSSFARTPKKKKGAMTVDSTDVCTNNFSLGNWKGVPVSRACQPQHRDVNRAGKRRLRGKRTKKIQSPVLATTAKGDEKSTAGDERSARGTRPVARGDKEVVNGCRDDDEEVDFASCPLRLMQTGSGGMLEFVFDDDDAAKRKTFHEAETALMLAEQRILLQMETLHHNRLKTGKHYWQSNESVSHCTRCGRPFSITVRKHHCRRCGVLLCNDCCSQVGRDMYALQTEATSKMEEEDVLLVNEDGESQDTAAAAAEGTSSPRNEYEWMFDTCDLTDGSSWRQDGGDDDKNAAQFCKLTASNAAQESGRGRGGLKVRTAPWCRICNCCYLICLRARIERNYSDVLSDGRRRFHVLRDDEQAFTNLNMAWEARVAQLDVLKHLIVERATSAAQGKIDHIASLFREWVRSLGRRVEKPPVEGSSSRSSCGSGGQ
ncbi:putative zinc finger protein [Trypanosoma conorhini]|uniref:Putative zinc finger protein n=1 Tax=Trypanosoma conorhini TaxID=83891 RepID=A0A422PVJ4_9TRYP|nr:putative zinc finger protein [Trypanosoma conorhini]RNF21785.1 putative zinc finger protein [Trypanosoma conorhini]